MDTRAVKERLRGRLLEVRREMPFEEVWRLSLDIEKRFMAEGFFRASERLSLYSSFGGEVLTGDIFEEATRQGKKVFYPAVTGGGLRFYRVTGREELSEGSYRIKEPAGGESVEASELDLIVVPGVAFDESGARLGFGKGYFDRALAEAKGLITALAYEFQVLEAGSIPCEAHDVSVDVIVTEERTIEVRGR
jgi:5,10-methenyltetrahydrofolate synthetase